MRAGIALSPTEAPAFSAVEVLHLNTGIMGHATYGAGLASALDADQLVRFTYVRLPDAVRPDLVGRLVRRTLVRPIPGFGRLPWHRLRSELAASLLTRRAIRRLSKEKRSCPFDVIHLHTQGLALLPLPLHRRSAVLVSLDATASLLGRHTSVLGGMELKLMRQLEDRCFKRADHVVAWSEWARQSLILDYGVTPERCSTIHPPVAIPARPALRSRSRDGRMSLLFIGSDFARKGGPLLLSVFKSQLRDSCTLSIVSSDPLAMRIGADIEGVRIYDRVSTNSAGFEQLFDESDAFVLPTTEEAYGIVLAEAMARAVPIVTTRVMAVPEVVGGDDGAALLVDKADGRALAEAIKRLVADAQLRNRLGQTGREIALKRNASSVVARSLAHRYVALKELLQFRF